MDNLEYLVAGLGSHVLMFHRCSPDIRRDTIFEFLEDQTILKTNMVYIASALRISQQINHLRPEPGAILMVSAAKDIFPIDLFSNITLIITDVPSGKLFNLATSLLRESISSYNYIAPIPDSKDEEINSLWEQVRNGRIVGHEEIRAAWHGILPDEADIYYRLSVIEPDDSSKFTQFTQYSQACEELRAVLDHGCLFPYNAGKHGKLILLQFFSSQPYGEFPVQEQFRTILEKFKLHMLVGHATRDYGRMNTVYRLYNRANYLASELCIEPGSRIYHFERYGMYSVIDMCAQRFIDLFGHADLLYLIHPVVVHISRYDSEHNTNLRDILFAYLTNNLDLKQTAEKLYMHRNTVSNKLNLIRSVTNVDFTHGDVNQRIIFSCQVIKYYEKVLSQNMRTSDHGTNA